MIRDLRFIEEYRHLLDDHIPDQLVHYRNVVNGESTPLSEHHHHCALQQCKVWIEKLTSLISDPSRLQLFQSRYPDWTLTKLNDYLNSLKAIYSSVGGHLKSSEESNLDSVKTVLNQHILDRIEVL